MRENSQHHWKTTQDRRGGQKELCQLGGGEQDAEVAGGAQLSSSHFHFSEVCQFHMKGDPKKINLSLISSSFQALFLKKLYHKFLSGFQGNIWCRGIFHNLTPFLWSLEFFMSNATLFWTKKCLFDVKILRQSCNFLCTSKNEENGHIECSNLKSITFPLSSRTLAMIFWV